jgi:hypothetical protein
MKTIRKSTHVLIIVLGIYKVAIKITWEWCLEYLTVYEDGTHDIQESDHAEVGNKSHGIESLLSNMEAIDEPFYFGIKRWSYDTWIEDADWEHIYLNKDGTFQDQWVRSYSDKEYLLPKYVMKEVEPHIKEIVNHKNFRD